MKRLYIKMFGVTPLLIVIYLILYKNGSEFTGFFLFLFVVLSFSLTIKEWASLRYGVEYIEFESPDKICVKGFKITDMERCATIKDVLISKADLKTIKFKLHSKRYILRKSELLTGDWSTILKELSCELNLSC